MEAFNKQYLATKSEIGHKRLCEIIKKDNWRLLNEDETERLAQAVSKAASDALNVIYSKGKCKVLNNEN